MLFKILNEALQSILPAVELEGNPGYVTNAVHKAHGLK
jgi:hypothetical protein